MNIFELFAESIPTRFDEKKTAAAAAFLLNAAGGRMQYIRLLKLLYMADREGWKRYGRPITQDDYVSMDHGPVLSKTYDLIKTEGAQPEPTGAWQETVERAGRFDVSLRGQPNYGPLSEAEIEILNDVHQRFAGMSTWDLIAHLHDILPEWTNPKGTSKEIPPEEILKKSCERRCSGTPSSNPQCPGWTDRIRYRRVYGDVFTLASSTRY